MKDIDWSKSFEVLDKMVECEVSTEDKRKKVEHMAASWGSLHNLNKFVSWFNVASDTEHQ